MAFNDDELIVATYATPYDQGTKGETFTEGNTKVTIIHKEKAPLEKCKLTVFLELTGAASVNERAGVDIVTVLDVSQTMEGEKLINLKLAMQFLIDKLSTADRLSVVTFCKDSKRLYPLRQMTAISQAETGEVVRGLECHSGGKNITAGLETAIRVINDRRISSGRVAAIVLMSDGNQIQAPTRLNFGNLPVYTIGFGSDLNPKVLWSIAASSNGGIFSQADAGNTTVSSLSIVLSPCLAGILGVAVEDLNLTVQSINSQIENVSAEYPLSQNASDNDVTIYIGNLYKDETRMVKVELLLPAVSSQQNYNALQISYSYRTGGDFCKASPRCVTVSRTPFSNREDKNEMNDGQDAFVDADNELGLVEVDQSQGLLKNFGSKLPEMPNVKFPSGFKRFSKNPFGSASRPSDSAGKQAELSKEASDNPVSITETKPTAGILNMVDSSIKQISGGSKYYGLRFPCKTSKDAETEQIKSVEQDSSNSVPITIDGMNKQESDVMETHLSVTPSMDSNVDGAILFEKDSTDPVTLVPTNLNETTSSNKKAPSWSFSRDSVEQGTKIVVDKVRWLSTIPMINKHEPSDQKGPIPLVGFQQSGNSPRDVEGEITAQQGQSSEQDPDNVQNEDAEDQLLNVLSNHLELVFKSVESIHDMLLKSVKPSVEQAQSSTVDNLNSKEENIDDVSLEVLSIRLEEAFQSVKAIQDMLHDYFQRQIVGDVKEENRDHHLEVSSDTFVDAVNEQEQVEVDQSQGLLKNMSSKLQQMPNVRLPSGVYRFPKNPFGSASKPYDSVDKQAGLSEETSDNAVSRTETKPTAGILNMVDSSIKQLTGGNKKYGLRFPFRSSKDADTNAESEQVKSVEQVPGNTVPITIDGVKKQKSDAVNTGAYVTPSMNSNVEQAISGKDSTDPVPPVPTNLNENTSDDQKAPTWSFSRDSVEQGAKIVVDKVRWLSTIPMTKKHELSDQKDPEPPVAVQQGESSDKYPQNAKNEDAEDLLLNVLSDHLQQVFKSVESIHDMLLKSVKSSAGHTESSVVDNLTLNKENTDDVSLEVLSNRLDEAFQSVKVIQDMLRNYMKRQIVVYVKEENRDDQLKVSSDSFVDTENKLEQVEVDQSQGLLKSLGSKLSQMPNVKLPSGTYRFPKNPFGSASRPSDSVGKQAELTEDSSDNPVSPTETKPDAGIFNMVDSSIKELTAGGKKYGLRFPFKSARDAHTNVEIEQVKSVDQDSSHTVPITIDDEVKTHSLLTPMDSNSEQAKLFQKVSTVPLPPVPISVNENASDDQKAPSWSFSRDYVKQGTKIVVDNVSWLATLPVTKKHEPSDQKVSEPTVIFQQGESSHKYPHDIAGETAGQQVQSSEKDPHNVKTEDAEDLLLNVLSDHLERVFKSVTAIHDMLLKSVKSSVEPTNSFAEDKLKLNEENIDDVSLEELSNRLDESFQSIKAIQDMLRDYLNRQIVVDVKEENRDDHLKVSSDNLAQAFKSVKVIKDIILNSVNSAEQGKSSEVNDPNTDDHLLDLLSDNLEQALKSVMGIQDTLLAMPLAEVQSMG